MNRRPAGKNQVTFPIGLGVGKTFKLGALPPIQTSLKFQWMVWHPDDFGQRFNIRLVLKAVEQSEPGSIIGGGIFPGQVDFQAQGQGQLLISKGFVMNPS